MTLQFKQELADINYFSRYAFLGEKGIVKVLLFVPVVIFIIWINFRDADIYTRNFFYTCVVISFILILTMVINLLVKKLKFTEKLYKELIGERQITLDDNGVKVSTPEGEFTYRWDAFSELRDSKKYYFLYMGRFSALIIPKRAFVDQDTAADFRHYVLGRIGTFEK